MTLHECHFGGLFSEVAAVAQGVRALFFTRSHKNIFVCHNLDQFGMNVCMYVMPINRIITFGGVYTDLLVNYSLVLIKL